jgi:DNA (cytosine-5)-methyltransferase 1
MEFKFIDLFAGIGGIRLAFEKSGGECVFSSEIDKFARTTYKENFNEEPYGDITTIDEKNIPNHDIILAGFPCQSFSLAGARKGFDDVRGTMFFEVVRIIKEHNPKVVFLENVKGLLKHDKGRTLSVILDILRSELNYYVPEPRVINAKEFGVPQNRERIFIVAFKSEIDSKLFKYPQGFKSNICIQDILEEKEVSSKYYLSETYIQTLINHKERHKEKGNGFGYEIKKNTDIASTIVVGGMGHERNLIIDKKLTNFKPVTNIKGEINREFIRKMTPREWARLQGFPETFKIVVSDTQAYKQFANSVAVPLVTAMAESIIKSIDQKGG